MSTDRLKDIGLGLGFLLLQILMFRHLNFWQMQPDAVFVFLLWFAATHERTESILMAAGLGLALDALLDTWGLHMFAKTLTIFVSFNFIPRVTDMRLLSGQIFLTILLAALFHQLTFLTLAHFVDGYAANIYFFRQWLGSAIYTAAVGSFMYIFTSS
jgi:rod shape-determining protein MreD